jgi:hypothetical protein
MSRRKRQVVVGVQMPADLKLRAEEAARQRFISVSALLRQSLVFFLEQSGRQCTVANGLAALPADVLTAGRGSDQDEEAS